MPYINPQRRAGINEHIDSATEKIVTTGELNYAITRLLRVWQLQWPHNYGVMNEIVGVLECVKQEYIRTELNPYEDEKRELNGDIFDGRTDDVKQPSDGSDLARSDQSAPGVSFGPVRVSG